MKMFLAIAFCLAIASVSDAGPFRRCVGGSCQAQPAGQVTPSPVIVQEAPTLTVRYVFYDAPGSEPTVRYGADVPFNHTLPIATPSGLQRSVGTCSGGLCGVPSSFGIGFRRR